MANDLCPLSKDAPANLECLSQTFLQFFWHVLYIKIRSISIKSGAPTPEIRATVTGITECECCELETDRKFKGLQNDNGVRVICKSALGNCIHHLGLQSQACNVGKIVIATHCLNYHRQTPNDALIARTQSLRPPQSLDSWPGWRFG